MNDFRFAEPQWVQLLWAVLAIGSILVWTELRGRSALNRFLSTLMQSRLVQSPSLSRRLISLICLLLSLVALVLAMMRPQWGATRRLLPRVGAQIMVCLDVSKSMLAEDTVPNRLERAKAELRDLLDLLQGEQVGLIAFAGRASVISPMTSDLGFLKLVLESTGTHSVGRGGTRLEEPIRKALAGFGEAADISRVILLITDGEDHDSFPLQAAEEARQMGIKMITIGFGDEAGSRIEVTDPRTGVRNFVQDSNGTPVVSRLDGDTLRELALKTEGVYIPAGTGALDLVSIHRQHIAPLVRGNLESGQQIIRNEAYQWVAVLSLVSLVLSLLIAGGSWTPAESRLVVGSRAGRAAVASLVIVLVLTGSIPAQSPAVSPRGSPSQPPGESLPATEFHQPSDQAGDSNPSDARPVAPDGAEELSAREAYNRSLAVLTADPGEAEAFLERARRAAGTDGEVRYRAAYNLGWVEVTRADRLLQDEPQEALQHLRSAADWFRRAVRIRPKSTDARHNLEIVLQRSMELADSLARKDRQDVANRLDALLQLQRDLLAAAGSLVERRALASAPDSDGELFRRDFRRLATEQRQVLSDAQSLAQQVGEELDRLNQSDELPREQRVRAGQLQGVAHYLQRATQRMGQTRSQLRRREDQRAFRRAALSLTELKRARDMLRAPHEILGLLVADSRSLLQQTQTLAAAQAALSPDDAPVPPSWLTPELVEQSQQSLTEQTSEWAAQMQLAFDAEPEDSPESRDAAQDRRRQLLQASPEIVSRAAEHFSHGAAAIQSDDLALAVDSQSEGLKLLLEAQELFLDLRGLIELAFATEDRILKVVTALPDLEGEQQDTLLEAARQLQTGNRERSHRIGEELSAEEERLATNRPTAYAPNAASPGGVDAGQQDTLRKRLIVARQLLQSARESMTASQQGLDGLPVLLDSAGSPSDSPTDLPKPDSGVPEAAEPEPEDGIELLAGHVQTAVDRLNDLRRLFFSIAEHLRETARRQSDLNDRTQELSAVTEAEERKQSLGPIGAQQEQLRETTQQIAQGLRQQAQLPSTTSGPPDPAQQQQDQQREQQLTQAAELVDAAETAMQAARQRMDAEPAEIPAIREQQDEALEKLLAALAQLTPPEEQPNPQQQQSDQPQQDQEQQEQQEQQQVQQQSTARQLLQLIRDREAQRRRERDTARSAGYEPVEKDW